MSDFTNFYSFERSIKAICKAFTPKTIIEWGPGFSTLLFIKYSNADIYCYEHFEYYHKQQKAWFENQYKDKCEDRIKKHHLASVGKEQAPITYVNAPLNDFKLGEVDVCFIDGLFRSECILIAKHLLKEDGIALMHDVFENHYDKDNGNFPYSFLKMERDRIGAFSKSEKTINKFKEAFNSIDIADEWKTRSAFVINN